MPGDKEGEIARKDGEMVGGSGSILTETLVGLGLGMVSSSAMQPR
jgi:hypothetical protein